MSRALLRQIDRDIEAARERLEVLNDRIRHRAFQVSNMFITRSELAALPRPFGELYAQTLHTESEIVAAAENPADHCGVYFLVESGRVVYVGQSVNIAGRVRDHIQTKKVKPDVKVAFVPCPRQYLNILETLYIHSLKPEKNAKEKRTGAPFAPIRFLDMLDALSS